MESGWWNFLSSEASVALQLLITFKEMRPNLQGKGASDSRGLGRGVFSSFSLPLWKQRVLASSREDQSFLLVSDGLAVPSADKRSWPLSVEN
jgi:hypothetical protein